MPPPRVPAQLPPELFRPAIKVELAPVTIDLPLLGGQAPVRLGAEKKEPAADFAAVIREFEAKPEAVKSLAERIDYGAALLFAGRYVEAVKFLVTLEREQPGQYAVAANLGTAYELSGDVEKAKLWIAKGVERNPLSHFGTEWLHLAILEAKLKLKADPSWLNTHSVLELAKDRPRSELAHALEYQLNERLYFIQRDDPVMCDLMYQAALATDDRAKRAFFLQQVPRFGKIRETEVSKLTHG